eukprot:TRINITY_DN20118_c0_g1_i1.p4 TRINITY_DN20118_c0_g1~~TRINITY_DN20118_c0_g1_i1.p4  ORF type:complete len:114 (-),score=30.05 TRINITY_DN20118_c0_g1_i1:1604-1924(-)
MASENPLRKILADEATLRQMAEAKFTASDSNHSGAIEKAELHAILREFMQQLDETIDESEVDAILAELDTDNSGSLSREEFVPLVTKLISMLADVVDAAHTAVDAR